MTDQTPDFVADYNDRIAQIQADYEASAAVGACMDCDRPGEGWSVDNALWNLVVGGPDAKDDPGGMLCMTCFVARAEGVVPGAIWRLMIAQEVKAMAKWFYDRGFMRGNNLDWGCRPDDHGAFDEMWSERLKLK